MTEAEELELLELEEQAAKTGSQKPKDFFANEPWANSMAHALAIQAENPAPPSRGRTAALGAAQGVLQNFADEAGGAYAKLMPQAIPKVPDWVPLVGGTDFSGIGEGVQLKQGESGPSTYELTRDLIRKEDKAAKDANPWSYGAGNVSGALGIGALASRLVPGAGGARLLAAKGEPLKKGLVEVMKAGAPLGLAEGALMGLGESESEDPLTAAAETGLGAIAGGFLGGVALPIGARGLQGLARAGKSVGRGLTEGFVQATPGAKLLRRKGVPLTTGQLNPASTLAQAEEISANTLLGRSLIQKQRNAANEAWQDVVMNEPRAPGAPPLQPGTQMNEAVRELGEGFSTDAAYGALKGHPVTPTEQSAFDALTRNPNIRATPETRQSVRDFLAYQMSSLPEAVGGRVPADAFHKVREGIRKEIQRTLAGSPGYQERAAAQMLGDAEDAITSAFERDLPENAARALRNADAKYRDFRILAKAVRKAKDAPEGFTPSQLSDAAASGTNELAYAKGAGGPLRDLARAGRGALEAKVPKTGVQALFGAPIVREATAIGSYLSNLPGPQRFLLGETTANEWARALERYAFRNAAAKALGTGADLTLNRTPAAIDAALGLTEPMWSLR